MAGLPMYDWPEVRDEVDALWSAIARRLGEAGVDAPTGLWRPERVEELWDTPDLLVGQTCGLNVVGDLRGRMEVLGVLDYAVEGCASGDYRSVLVCRSLDAIHLAAARRRASHDSSYLRPATGSGLTVDRPVCHRLLRGVPV